MAHPPRHRVAARLAERGYVRRAGDVFVYGFDHHPVYFHLGFAVIGPPGVYPAYAGAVEGETRGGVGHIGAGIVASARIGIADRAPCAGVDNIGVVVFILAVAYSCRGRRIGRRRRILGVAVFVAVFVGVLVRVGVFVGVFVAVGVGVFVASGVFVGIAPPEVVLAEPRQEDFHVHGLGLTLGQGKAKKDRPAVRLQQPYLMIRGQGPEQRRFFVTASAVQNRYLILLRTQCAGESWGS